MDWIVESLTVIIHALSGSITTPLNKFHIYLRCIAQIHSLKSVTFLAIFIALLTVHCSDLKNTGHFFPFVAREAFKCMTYMSMWCENVMRHIVSHQLEVCSLKVVCLHTTVECCRLSSTLCSSLHPYWWWCSFLCMVLVLLLIHSPLNRSLRSHENIHKWRNLLWRNTIKHLRVC